ncbi:hypothetical protein OsI_36796 [Oryza sativa Indica Group]|uniref:Uncharacterized protein n=1 Tax=Oryza sativa subsp. indica TaxID=39946 RepID=A2ZG93_ORYSI|nr:hypothetical protein OsI_36796 [Oryza sativa Indica Group]
MPPGYKNFSKELLACFLIDQLDDYLARKNKIHDKGVKPILELVKNTNPGGAGEDLQGVQGERLCRVLDHRRRGRSSHSSSGAGRRRGRPGVIKKKHTGGTKNL